MCADAHVLAIALHCCCRACDSCKSLLVHSYVDAEPRLLNPAATDVMNRYRVPCEVALAGRWRLSRHRFTGMRCNLGGDSRRHCHCLHCRCFVLVFVRWLCRTAMRVGWLHGAAPRRWSAFGHSDQSSRPAMPSASSDLLDTNTSRCQPPRHRGRDWCAPAEANELITTWHVRLERT